MGKSAKPATYVYLPYADEQGTGLQRFGSEMIRSMLDAGTQIVVVLGEVQGAPRWLQNIPHWVALKPSLTRRLPRPISSLLRLLWLQLIFPLRVGRNANVITLADRDVAIFPRYRQIAVAHDLTQAGQYRQKSNIAHNLRNILWKKGLHNSAQVIAISSATKRDLVEIFGIPSEKIRVVYEGFDPLTFKPPVQRSGGRPYLLYAGTLAPNKNIPFLLKVYARVRERHEVDLVLVGKQASSDVASLLAKMPEPARDGVLFRGFVTDDELAALMGSCAAFLFPSLNEGFGLAVVEAMACGAPVVSSNAGSLTEVVDFGGVLLDPNDADDWFEVVNKVLSVAAFRTQLAERALRRSSDFSWNKAAESYRAVIEAADHARTNEATID